MENTNATDITDVQPQTPGATTDTPDAATQSATPQTAPELPELMFVKTSKVGNNSLLELRNGEHQLGVVVEGEVDEAKRLAVIELMREQQAFRYGVYAEVVGKTLTVRQGVKRVGIGIDLTAVRTQIDELKKAVQVVVGLESLGVKYIADFRALRTMQPTKNLKAIYTGCIEAMEAGLSA